MASETMALVVGASADRLDRDVPGRRVDQPAPLRAVGLHEPQAGGQGVQGIQEGQAGRVSQTDERYAPFLSTRAITHRT